MKSLAITVAVLLALFSGAAEAKDAAFDAFWTKFQTALKTNDKEAIADMTRMPYQSYDKPLDRKAFIAYCDKIFSKKTRDCLVKQKPVEDKTNFCAFCGEEIYYFEKVNGKYLFTEIGPND